MRARSLLILVGCVALLPAACSSGGGGGGSTVSGKVTHNGTPVAGAKVIFTDGKDESERPSGPTATTDESGEYAIVGVKPGAYKVVVYKLAAKGGELPEGIDLEQVEAAGGGIHELPKKYAKPGTTTLTAQVENGSNKDVNFDLKGK